MVAAFEVRRVSDGSKRIAIAELDPHVQGREWFEQVARAFQCDLGSEYAVSFLEAYDNLMYGAVLAAPDVEAPLPYSTSGVGDA